MKPKDGCLEQIGPPPEMIDDHLEKIDDLLAKDRLGEHPQKTIEIVDLIMTVTVPLVKIVATDTTGAMKMDTENEIMIIAPMGLIIARLLERVNPQVSTQEPLHLEQYQMEIRALACHPSQPLLPREPHQMEFPLCAHEYVYHHPKLCRYDNHTQHVLNWWGMYSVVWMSRTRAAILGYIGMLPAIDCRSVMKALKFLLNQVIP